MIGAIVAGALSEPAPLITGSYESIQTYTVGSGGQSTVTFSSIPSTYTHLQLRAMNLMTSNYSAMVMAVGNGSADTTAANYSVHYLGGNGTATAAGYSVSLPQFAWITGNDSSSYPEVEIIDFLDYTNGNKYKTVRGLSGVDNNGSGEVTLTSFAWKNTAAINTIRLTCNSGNFGQYSSFALYGIKG